MAPHRETSHAGPGRPVPDWDLTAFTPPGLRSTAPDLVRFLGANLDAGHSDHAVPLEDVHRSRRPIGANEEMGLGWHIRHDGATAVAWHNGGTAASGLRGHGP